MVKNYANGILHISGEINKLTINITPTKGIIMNLDLSSYNQNDKIESIKMFDISGD